MADLPEAAVRAAEGAYRCAHGSGVPEREIARIVAVAAVEAAAPAIAAQERADVSREIAKQIRAQTPSGNTQVTWEGALRRAARVARQIGEAP